MRAWITSTFILISLGLSAQEFDAGLKAGVNFMEVDLNEFSANQAYENLQSSERGVGYHAGAFARVEFDPIFIQQEVVFTQLNQTLTAQPQGASEPAKVMVDFNRLDIPLMFGLKLGPFRLGGGPVGSFNIEDGRNVFNNSLEDATWGYQLGVGLDISNISLDVRYEDAFSNTANQLVIDETAYQFDTRTNQVIASFSVRLF